MEKVVYLLGAGFSAPLGLPVMANFLEMSRDMYFAKDGKENYKHFGEVFETINRLSKAKNYYDADLHNIEEILSILEMEELSGENQREKFVKYLGDVIKRYTPNPRVEPNFPFDRDCLFGKYNGGPKSEFEMYGTFVLALCQIRLDLIGNSVGRYVCSSVPVMEYSVVTLNYDIVLERFADFISHQHANDQCRDVATFHRPSTRKPGTVLLAKLHGSVDDSSIVPPTWNKTTLTNSAIKAEWAAAHKALSEANHIRILGYSLPISDAYVKFLLKSAVLECDHLKTIDIICRDKSGRVRERFADFIRFHNVLFSDGDIRHYLDEVRKCKFLEGQRIECYKAIESAHRTFFHGDHARPLHS